MSNFICGVQHLVSEMKYYFSSAMCYFQYALFDECSFPCYCSGDGERSGAAGIFVSGFVLGGIVVGALGAIYAPQVRMQYIQFSFIIRSHFKVI